jgi:hypothetical protein
VIGLTRAGGRFLFVWGCGAVGSNYTPSPISRILR